MPGKEGGEKGWKGFATLMHLTKGFPGRACTTIICGCDLLLHGCTAPTKLHPPTPPVGCHRLSASPATLPCACASSRVISLLCCRLVAAPHIHTHAHTHHTRTHSRTHTHNARTHTCAPQVPGARAHQGPRARVPGHAVWAAGRRGKKDDTEMGKGGEAGGGAGEGGRGVGYLGGQGEGVRRSNPEPQMMAARH